VTDADNGQAQFNAESLQGQFGTLSINNLGHWTYTADNSQAAIQGLKTGESLTETLLVHSVDGTEQKISVTINGTDDKAVITGTSTASLTEDKDVHSGQLRVDGALSVTDADNGQAQFNAESLQGQFGALSINNLGHWAYTADNSQAAIQGLKTGESLTETLLVHSVDGTEQKITVTINGTDDKAVIAGTSTASLTEDKDVHSGQLRVDGALTVTDADNGQAQFNAESLQGQFGTLSINNLGHWTYTADNSQAAIQGLKTGESLTETLLVHSVDGTEQKISVTINGTDDKAVIGGVDTGSVTENSAGKDMSPDYAQPGMAHLGRNPLYASGTLTISDLDSGEAAFNTHGVGFTYSGKFGDLLLQENGQWTYYADAGGVRIKGGYASNRGSTIDQLGEGQSLTDTITVYSKDGTSHDIVITIHGSNDRPYCSSEVVLQSGTEDTRQTLTTAQLLANTVDVDANDAGKLTIENLHADHGSILINGDGTFTFTPEKDYNGAVHFSYDVKDAHGGMTHTGASTTLAAVQDNAVIAGIDTGSVTEDLNPHASVQGNYAYKLETQGSLSAIDPDKDESGFDFKTLISAATHPEWRPYSSSLGGQLAIDPKGNWNYYIDNRKPEIQHLGKGETLTDTVTVHSKDGTTHDIVITIHGTNDAPTVSSEVQLNSGKEDSVQTITAADLLAHATDIDGNDQGQLTVANLIANHGSIRDNQDGTFTFSPEKDYNGEVHFTYDVKDAHGGITHTGASTNLAAVDDKTVFGGVSTDSVKEDIDPGVSSYGNFGGSRFADSQWHQLTITDIDSKVDQVDIEFGGKTVTWQVGSPLDIQTKYGKFELTTYSHGPHKGELVWLYNGDNRNPSIQGLKEGESLHESITLVAPDGTRQSLSVEIKGTEDHVIIDSPNHIGDVIEHQSTGAQVSGQLQAHDSDTHDSVSWAITQTTGKYGAFSIDANGQWHYIVDESKAGALGQGDEWNEHFTIEALSTDGSKVSKTVTVVVHGSNDAPTVTSGLVLTQSSEDKQVILTQQDLLAHASDSDRNDQGWLKATHLTADHGSVSTNADGSFTFTPEKDYNGVVHFNYDVIDRHGGTTHTDATINLVAVNDASILASALSSNEVIEDHLSGSSSHTLTSYWKNLDITDTDGQADAQIVKIEVNGVEHNVPANFAMTLQGAHGSFVTTHGVDGHNKWRYVADNNHTEIQQLKDGQSLTDHMTLITADGTRIPITATIKGTEDHVIIDTPDSLTASIGTAIEDQKTALSGTLQAHDVDKDDSVHFQTQNITGNFGSFSVAKDGTWHYQLDAAKAQHLTTGQNRTEEFDIVAISSDGSKATQHIQINVQGSNDSAIIAGVDTGSITEDRHVFPDSMHHIQVTGSLSVSDPDDGEDHFRASGAFGHEKAISDPFQGEMHIDRYGNWDYVLANGNPAVQALKQGETKDVIYEVHSADGTPHRITITVTGTNDAPTVSSSVILATGKEDTTVTLQASDLLAHASDIDHKAQLSIHNLSADHGQIVDNHDGTFRFIPDKDYNGPVALTYDIKDAHNGSVTTSASLNLAPTSDAAIIGGQDSGGIKEDVNVSYNHDISINGWLSIHDPDGPSQDEFQQFDPMKTPQGATLQLYSNGHWYYDANNYVIDHLDAGQTVKDTMTIYSKDGTPHVMHFIIEGTNDVPQIKAQTQTVTEDGKLLSGTMQARDVDDHAKLEFTLDHPVQGITLQKDGSYTFVPSHAAYQHISANVTRTILVPITVTDEHGAHTTENLSILITGTNDGAVIAGSDSGAVTEDVNVQNHELQTQGTLTSHDVDNVDNAFTDESLTTLKDGSHALGTLHMDQSGTWTYTVDNKAIQSMKSGDQKVETFLVHSVDGTSHEVAVTIHGTNDTAQITGQHIGDITEDNLAQYKSEQMIYGNLHVIDPDANESEFIASRNVHTVSDPFGGHLSIGRAGGWTYSVPNANLNHLAEGETVQVTYQVHSRGGDTHNITIDVVGTNDAPTINVHTLQSGTEDVSYQMQASQFGFTDVDSKDTLHSITLTNLPSLAEGKFVLDGHDVATNQRIDVSEISKLQFVPAKDFNGDVHFSYTVNDGHTDSAIASSILHIAAAGDAATIDGQSQSSVSASVTEDSSTNVISGQLTLIDPDTGEDRFAANTQIVGQYGQLTLDENGSWHYALNNASSAVNSLNAGQQLTDTLTVTSPDGSASQTLAITIHGHTDTPSLQLQEAGTTQGLDLFAGIQGNQISQLQYSTDGINFTSQIPAGFSLAADGHTLEVDPAHSSFDHLANGVQHKIWVNYQLQESSGSNTHQSSQQAQVIISGTSDKPIIHSFSANSDQYSGPVTGNLLQGASDIDDGAQLTLQDVQFKDPTTHHYITVHTGQDVSITGVGQIHIAANGDYRFTPESSFTGDVPGFIYRVVDTHGDYQDNSQNTLNIHLNANHQPTVQTLNVSTAEDTDFQFNRASFGYQDSDNDALDHLSITQLPDPTSGSLELNGQAVTQGQAISAKNIDQLVFKPSANFNGDVHFSYTVNDGHQNSTAHTAILNVTAVNDLPTLTINQTSHTQGKLVATDVDTGDTLTYSTPLAIGDFGSLSIDPQTGAYQYTQNSSVAHMSYNSATATYSGVDVFEVQVSDNHGGITSQFITFNPQATVSSTSTGTIVITSQVPQQPVVTSSLPTGHIVATPPINHVSIDLSATSDTGKSHIDDLTSDTTPNITGHTDIPFSRVTIYDANHPVSHALSDANGNYTATLSTLTDGHHSLSAKALAPSSVLPAVSPVLDIKIDSVTATPSIDLAAHSDSGTSNTDNLTNIHSPIVTGVAEANSTISITDEHGNILASGSSNANGQYQFTANQLSEGMHTLTVEATDNAGNQSREQLAIEVDYTAPTIAKVNLKTESTHQPTFSGTVSLDTAKVDIIIKQGSHILETLHANLDGKGGYSVDATNLPDGAYTAFIQATDNAGNQTPAGYSGNYDHFSVDTHANPPSISFESTGSDNVYNAAEVAAGAANTITATIHLPNDSYSSDTLVINGVPHTLTHAEFLAGQVNVEIAPSSTLTASIIDSVGNHSSLTSSVAPSADITVATLGLSLTNDSGLSTDLITNDGALTISGQEVGATVEYSTDNGVHWSQSFTPVAGTNTVTVRQTDNAGNVSASTSMSFTLDNQVSAPTVSLRHDTSGEIHPTADLITKDSRLSIHSEAGAKVEYSSDSGHSWSTVFNPTEGVNNLLVRQTDIAGNQSAATHFSFTLDTTPGTVSVNPISTDNALSAVENNQPLVITGTTSNITAGDRVYINFGNNHFREASIHSDGTWSLTVSAGDHQRYFSADGNYPIKIGSVDLAGNATPEISTNLIVDTQRPIPHISVDSVTADNVINLAESAQNIDITGTVSGDFNAGDIVSLSINGATISSLTAAVDASGHYSISVPAQTLIKANIHSIYASGQQPIHSIEATVITTDNAGNLGSATTGTQAFSIDTQASAAITIDPITADNVINAHESQTKIDITGSVTGDYHTGDTVTLTLNGNQYSGQVNQQGHYSIAVAGSELASNSSISASVTTTDNVRNTAHATQTLHYDTDTQVGRPSISFESPGSDNLYSKTEIAQGHAGTITATVHAAADAKVGEHLNINGVDHLLDANTLAHGIEIEVAPSSIVKAIMTDEHGNVNSALSMAASAKPEPIVVTALPGSHHIGTSLGVPTLIPGQTPVPVAEQGWKILVNGHYQTSYTSQWGTLTIDPKTGQLSYQEHGNTHTGPHGSAQNVGVHEDRFEVALQGSHHDDVVMHVQVSILSHGPGNSGKLTLGSEVLDMTVTPVIGHPAPPPPPPAPVMHDEPLGTEVTANVDEQVIADDSVLDKAPEEDNIATTADSTANSDVDRLSHGDLQDTPENQVAAPIDHYLNMVGMTHQDIAPPSDSTVAELPQIQVLSNDDINTDMLDVEQSDSFENPLLDDEKHQQQLDLASLDDSTEPAAHDPVNDDDLLHQALNDMHNQV
ncbi:VCBS domain-containing protein, partial [Shewanella schlegeliana]